MEHRKDFHALSFNALDDSVGALDHFAYTGEAELRDHTARVREQGNLGRAPCEPVDHPIGVVVKSRRAGRGSH